MAQSYTEMLEQHYANQHTEILIEIKIKGELTDEAKGILEAELSKRKIKTEEIEEYKASGDVYSHSKKFDKEIGFYNLASIPKRYIAQLIDQIIGIVFPILIAVIANQIFFQIASLILFLGYSLFHDAMPNGQSFGKKILGIKVVNMKTGNACSVKESFIRSITKLPIIAFIDAIMIFSAIRRRLGDRLAGTIVVNM